MLHIATNNLTYPRTPWFGPSSKLTLANIQGSFSLISLPTPVNTGFRKPPVLWEMRQGVNREDVAIVAMPVLAAPRGKIVSDFQVGSFTDAMGTLAQAANVTCGPGGPNENAHRSRRG